MKILKKILMYTFAVLLCIVLFIGLVLYLLFVPFDIIRYRRMPYYKDTRKKFELFITSKDIVLFYNKLKQKNLPIEYHCNKNYEYFIKDGTVLLPDWLCDSLESHCFEYSGLEEKNGEWYFLFEYDSGSGESDTVVRTPMQEILLGKLEYAKEEHRSLPAKFLIFEGDKPDTEEEPMLKNCPYCYMADEI